ncbi:MAG TPA: hypothetical protein VFL91_21190, partial [Thermomicrobiales bacterium]|nr:hypothetical protein [Thermomicrobiales bacterium]
MLESDPAPEELASPGELEEPDAATKAGYERDRVALVRWRRGELRGPDLPEPPEEETPAVGTWLPARRPPVVIDGERPWAPQRGRPSWAALVIVAVLAALFGGSVTAAFSRPAAPATALTAPTAGATAQEPPASATPAMVALLAAPTASPLATPSRRASSTAAPPASPSTPAAPTSKATAPGRTAAATPTLRPEATPLELAGTAASALPGTRLRLGQPVTSVVDTTTKPRDVYAVDLRAGQRLRPELATTGGLVTLALGPPGVPASDADVLCIDVASCPKTVPIAADG